MSCDSTDLVSEGVDVVVEGESDVGRGGRQVARHQSRTRPIQTIVDGQVGSPADLHRLHALLDTARINTQVSEVTVTTYR